MATEIMAGKGPDVLSLDNIDLNAYTKKGILLDLRDGVGGMMDSGEVMPNIVGAYGSQSGLFAVPTRLGLPCLVSTPENIRRAGTLESIAQFAREHPEKRILHEPRPEMLMATFYLSCAPAWFQTPGKFDEPLFIRFLEDIKSLSRDEEGGEPNDPTADATSLMEMAAGRTEYHFTVSWGFSSIRELYAAAARRVGDSFAPRDFSECIAPLPGQSAGMDAFSPMCIIGVNVQSENKEDALAFIRTALSRDVQRTDLGDGYPVNTQALRDSFDQRVNGWHTIIGDEIGIPGFELEMPSSPIEAQEAVVDPLMALKTPVQADYAMQEILRGYGNGGGSGVRSRRTHTSISGGINRKNMTLSLPSNRQG